MDDEEMKSVVGVGEAIASGLATFGGIPLPPALQRGFFKALSRLAGAAIDIPAAKLESYSDGIRAATEARSALTHQAANVLVSDFQSNPEIAARAQAHLTSRIIREQVNVEDILRKPAENLTKSSVHTEPLDEIDDDWWNSFEAEAPKKSTDDFKEIFARILCGEIERPGSFSIKSIRAIGDIGKSTAKLFQVLSSISISNIYDARVVALGGNAGANALLPYGIGFMQLQLLEQYGLINSDLNNWMDYAPWINMNMMIDYAGQPHRITKSSPGQGELKLVGVSFTEIGKELRKIVDMTEVPTYTSALKSYFESMGYTLLGC